MWSDPGPRLTAGPHSAIETVARNTLFTENKTAERFATCTVFS